MERQPPPPNTTVVTDFNDLIDSSIPEGSCNNDAPFSIVDSTWSSVSESESTTNKDLLNQSMKLLSTSDNSTCNQWSDSVGDFLWSKLSDTPSDDFVTFVGRKPDNSLYTIMGLMIRPDNIAQFGACCLIEGQGIYFESNFVAWVLEKLKSSGVDGFYWTISDSYEICAAEWGIELPPCCFKRVAEIFKEWCDANSATLEVRVGDGGVHFSVDFSE